VPRPKPLQMLVVSSLTAILVVAACGGTSSSTSGNGRQPFVLRLGYLANLTHAGAMIDVDRGFLKASLPSGTTVTTQVFSAGPDEVEAILGGALDAAFMGPSAAINGYVKSRAIVVVSGATLGGAGLVVRPGLNLHSPADLRGRTLATPELGNTQDVALRAYLADHGLRTDPQGGGDVHVVPTSNAIALSLLEQGKIDGAWVPEPWLSRMVIEAHARLFVDEASLWPQGRFATTELVVTRKLLTERPEVVKGLIRSDLETVDWMGQHPDEARSEAGTVLAKLTNSMLSTAVLDSAWARLTFTVDPLSSSFKKEAANARRVGLLKAADLSGILDLRPLNAVLKAAGRPPVSAAGLGPA
jgi:NitT/TauT family transport system substrate-binding protein